MGAGNGNHVPPLKNVFAHPLRARGVGGASVKNGFKQGVAAAHGVTDHPKVGFHGHLFGTIPLRELNAGKL